tara:strand:- start:285 stop:791 length:507 start_codon:yes stop_codon:yes gene_type:complete
MEISQLAFNQPIPGESFTVKSGSYPYENPALIDTPKEAFKFLMDTYNANNTSEQILKMIMAGLTIEYIVNVIIKSGFIEGVYTVDVAEILKPALTLQFLADARDAGVENIKIMNDSSIPEFSDIDYINLKQELRPETLDTMAIVEEPLIMDEQIMPEEQSSFLDMEME